MKTTRSQDPPGFPTWGKWAIAAGAAVTVGVVAAKLFHSPRAQAAIKNPHQAWVILTNPHRPWLSKTSFAAYDDAIKAQIELFGNGHHVDDAVDAYRHAYAAGLLKLRIVRDHGVLDDVASRLVTRIAHAHELDGVDNALRLSSFMDEANTAAGLSIFGKGITGEGSWISEPAWRNKVLDALNGGKLQRIADAGTALERLIPT